MDLKNILIIESLNKNNLNKVNEHLKENDLKYQYVFIDEMFINDDVLCLNSSCVKVFIFNNFGDNTSKNIKSSFKCVLYLAEDLKSQRYIFMAESNHERRLNKDFKQVLYMNKMTDLIEDYDPKQYTFNKIANKYLDNNYNKVINIDNSLYYIYQFSD
jgi:hypothetical protein